jgi:hypothetical protein
MVSVLPQARSRIFNNGQDKLASEKDISMNLKNITKNRNIVLGIGLLSVGAFNLAQPAQAAPRREVRSDRRDVKQARREVREEKRDVQRASTWQERQRQQRDLAAAQANLRRQQQELRRDRPGRGNVYQNGTFRTLEGTVVGDWRGNSFTLRTSANQQLLVQVQGGEPRRLSIGDRVRVSGSTRNGRFYAQSLNIVRNH